MGEDKALEIGLAVLAYVASDEAALSRFISETGVDASEFKPRASEPAFLGALLDFLFADESSLLAFCRAEKLPVNAIIKARAALPGGISTLEGWA